MLLDSKGNAVENYTVSSHNVCHLHRNISELNNRRDLFLGKAWKKYSKHSDRHLKAADNSSEKDLAVAI